ncbi:hypothetical protein EV356DRAFT_533613 [Viridothelium virens]|uniref:Uncharacterized protein n=1 Tax=Viridothelium virens TaxID=1048519 RepID=A0A6A6H723_VIRVR|nr:hypothetical protein EV356DRAFT_533613 [Viridothelium virens]
MARKLRKEFKLDKFVVTPNTDNLGLSIVHCGAHGQGPSTAQVAGMSNGVGRNENYSDLNPAEAYPCVAALPLKARLDILLTSQVGSNKLKYSQFVLDSSLNSRDGLGSGNSNVTTESLFDSKNDKVSTVLGHDLIKFNAAAAVDNPSSPAGQLLRSIIQPALCQTNEQLMMRWLSPVKRTRSLVRKSLMAKVSNVVASDVTSTDVDPRESEQRIKTLKRSVSQKLSNKNYQRSINSSVQNITHNAIRDMKSSLPTIEEFNPKSVYKSRAVLSSQQEAFHEAEKQRNLDKSHYRQWRQELGMELIEETTMKIEEITELEDDSVIGFPDLTSSTSNEQSMLSYVSEASMELTMPEMDATTLSKNEMAHESPSRISEIDSWPLSSPPQFEDNSAGPSELHADASSPTREPLQHGFELYSDEIRAPSTPALNHSHKPAHDMVPEEPPV